MRELLIVGIDPGTTVGYAVLDTKGNVLRTRSSKQLELNSLVEEIAGMGSVLAAGTDREKCPALIEKFAAKMGARTIVPKEDLLVAEKDAMASGHGTLNSHEKDALAAALYAYKELEPLLRRIEKVLEAEGKTELFSEVTELVVIEGRNIKGSVQTVEERKSSRQEETEIEAVAAAPEKTAKEAMQELQLKSLQRENVILREYNSKLLSRMKQINKELRRVSKKKSLPAVTNCNKTHRDELARKMQGIIDEKETRIGKLEGELALLGKILESNGVVVKKLKALGFDETQHLKDNDTILVRNVDSFSEKAVGNLQHKNITVITREKASGNVSGMFQQKGIPLIEAEGVIMLESEGFAAADGQKLAEAKKKLEAMGSKNVLGMIESYKEERKFRMM